MTTLPQRALRAALLLLALLALAPATALAGSAGKVNITKDARSSFDVFTQAPSLAQQAWMRDHYSRMQTYASYFDSRVSWFPSAWSYADSYAIYPGKEAGLEQYILKDSAGNRLYIPYACSGGTCSQYAADIGDPGWRQNFINRALAKVAAGYKGIWVDDVNLAFKVGDGNGNFVAPIDDRTGTTMTLENWQRYFAEFMEQLRASLPADFEIVQNQVYYHAGPSNAYVKRAIEASTHIEIERGVIDTGIVGGTGKYGYETVLAWADYIHSRNKGVIWDAKATWGREYQIATNLLVANGLDLLDHPEGSNPDNWWTGYETDLGQPLGDRYSWNGVFRRDFEKGIALVNQPGQTTKTLTLEADYNNLAGSTVSSVTLAARTGAVLLRTAPAPAPTPTPTPTPTPVLSDTTPPDTSLSGGPTGTVTELTATFGLVSTEAGSSFDCRLDGSVWAPCTDPVSLSSLSLGSHTFEARARDSAGNVDPSPASRTWSIKRARGRLKTATSASASLSGLVVRGRAVRRTGDARVTRSRVRIVLQRRDAGRWVRVARRSVRVRAGGRFATTFYGMRPGRYRVRLRSLGKARLRVMLDSGMPRRVRI